MNKWKRPVRFLVDEEIGEVYAHPKVGDELQWMDLKGKPAAVQFKFGASPCAADDDPAKGHCTATASGYFKYRCTSADCTDPGMEVEPSTDSKGNEVVAKPASTIAPNNRVPDPRNPTIYCDSGITRVETVNNGATGQHIRWQTNNTIASATITFNSDNLICDKASYTYPGNLLCTFQTFAKDSYTYSVKADKCSEGSGTINKAK